MPKATFERKDRADAFEVVVAAAGLMFGLVPGAGVMVGICDKVTVSVPPITSPFGPSQMTVPFIVTAGPPGYIVVPSMMT